MPLDNDGLLRPWHEAFTTPGRLRRVRRWYADHTILGTTVVVVVILLAAVAFSFAQLNTLQQERLHDRDRLAAQRTHDVERLLVKSCEFGNETRAAAKAFIVDFARPVPIPANADPATRARLVHANEERAALVRTADAAFKPRDCATVHLP